MAVLYQSRFGNATDNFYERTSPL